MSYTRSYRETVSTTVSVSYPKSENGGSQSVHVDIPVDVNIHVDTTPFDNSVQHCGTNVDVLTAAVVATETAEIISKEENSKKVGETIVNGFFSYIRSEISQQIAELSQTIDAHLMHLRELANSCLAKTKQMEGDYHRISGRYIKTFEDLNKELSNRIYELDKPAFVFKKETDDNRIRISDNDLISMVSIGGAESSGLQSRISSSIAKKRALDALNKAKLFLMQQRQLNLTIQQSMLNESASGSIFTPVCLFESISDRDKIDKTIFATNFLPVLNDQQQKNNLLELFSTNSIKWSKLSQDELHNIGLYFNAELNSKSAANDQHSVRVRETIQQLADIKSINAINI